MITTDGVQYPLCKRPVICAIEWKPTVKFVAALLVVIITAAARSRAVAEDFSATLDYASAYVFRGTPVNDRSVLQPALQADSDLGLTLGVWGNFNLAGDSSGSLDSGDFSEIDLYLSCTLPVRSDRLNLSAGYTEYTYPGSEIPADREINIIAAFDALLQPSLGIYYGVDGAINSQWYFEAAAGHSWELMPDLTLGFTGTLGALRQADNSSAKDGLSYARGSVELSYRSLTAAYYYYAETDRDVLEVATNHVGMLSAQYKF